MHFITILAVWIRGGDSTVVGCGSDKQTTGYLYAQLVQSVWTWFSLVKLLGRAKCFQWIDDIFYLFPSISLSKEMRWRKNRYFLYQISSVLLVGKLVSEILLFQFTLSENTSEALFSSGISSQYHSSLVSTKMQKLWSVWIFCLNKMRRIAKRWTLKFPSGNFHIHNFYNVSQNVFLVAWIAPHLDTFVKPVG